MTAPPSAAWLTWFREAWDAGAAVLPVDDRLSRSEQDTLIAIRNKNLEAEKLCDQLLGLSQRE